MARTINGLSARTVRTLTEAGRHADGLTFVVDDGGGKRSVARFHLAGKRGEMGLGPLRMVSLAHARERAGKARALAAQGPDPVAARPADRLAPEMAQGRTTTTFADIADAFTDARASERRKAKHRQQWRTTLRAYAANLWSRRTAACRFDRRIGRSGLGAAGPIGGLLTSRPLRTASPFADAALRLALPSRGAEAVGSREQSARHRGFRDRQAPSYGRSTRLFPGLS